MKLCLLINVVLFHQSCVWKCFWLPLANPAVPTITTTMTAIAKVVIFHVKIIKQFRCFYFFSSPGRFLIGPIFYSPNIQQQMVYMAPRRPDFKSCSQSGIAWTGRRYQDSLNPLKHYGKLSKMFRQPHFLWQEELTLFKR